MLFENVSKHIIKSAIILMTNARCVLSMTYLQSPIEL